MLSWSIAKQVMPVECQVPQTAVRRSRSYTTEKKSVNLIFLAANVDDMSAKVLLDLFHAHTVENLSSVLLINQVSRICWLAPLRKVSVFVNCLREWYPHVPVYSCHSFKGVLLYNICTCTMYHYIHTLYNVPLHTYNVPLHKSIYTLHKEYLYTRPGQLVPQGFHRKHTITSGASRVPPYTHYYKWCLKGSTVHTLLQVVPQGFHRKHTITSGASRVPP